MTINNSTKKIIEDTNQIQYQNHTKIAVIICNLGGPNNLDNVRQFLFNLFYDPAIITMPNPWRWLFATFMSLARKKKAQKIYQQMGGKSPIVEETNDQKTALENLLNLNVNLTASDSKLNKSLGEKTGTSNRAKSSIFYKVFTAMRYSPPRGEEVVNALEDYMPKEIIILPLYPQFSTTTSASSIAEIKGLIAHSKKLKDIKAKSVGCHFWHHQFINSTAEIILKNIHYAEQKNTKFPIRILFSAHSLPQKIIDKGDPYQLQIEQSVAAIMEKINVFYPQIEHIICYQSKVGKFVKWLEPSTEKEIVRAGKEKYAIIVVPIAFVSEHSETLVELDIEYGELAQEAGVPLYLRSKTLRTEEQYISCLADLVQSSLEINKGEDKYSIEEEIIAKQKQENLKRQRICLENEKNCFCFNNKNS